MPSHRKSDDDSVNHNNENLFDNARNNHFRKLDHSNKDHHIKRSGNNHSDHLVRKNNHLDRHNNSKFTRQSACGVRSVNEYAHKNNIVEERGVGKSYSYDWYKKMGELYEGRIMTKAGACE